MRFYSPYKTDRAKNPFYMNNCEKRFHFMQYGLWPYEMFMSSTMGQYLAVMDSAWWTMNICMQNGSGCLSGIHLYSKTCVRRPPLKRTLVVDVEKLLSYKGICHVILLAKLHDMYLYKTDYFFHINHYLKSASKVALLHRFYSN